MDTVVTSKDYENASAVGSEGGCPWALCYPPDAPPLLVSTLDPESMAWLDENDARDYALSMNPKDEKWTLFSPNLGVAKHALRIQLLDPVSFGFHSSFGGADGRTWVVILGMPA